VKGVKPRRVQLRRTKGWRLPADTVVVTRPGRWGNPFRVGGWFRLTAAGWEEAAKPGESGFTRIVDRAMAVDWFVRWRETRWPDVSPLRGRNLACWCRPGEPCHAEVLLRWANTGGKEPGSAGFGIRSTVPPADTGGEA
jgi:hypothetical protein